LIIGVVCVLVGLVLVLVWFVDADAGRDDQPGATTTSTAVGSLDVPALSTGTTAPLDGADIGVGVGPEVGGRTPLRGFGEVAATITSEGGEVCEVCLLSAVTPEQRARGLMEVTDESLGGYDGMLFEFPTEVDGAFWMRSTPLPLSIAYFDASGALVSTEDMAPCGDEDEEPTCPSYPAAAPFAFALEVPEGLLDDIGVEGAATLVIDARVCPEADGDAAG
jgi:uncharacterized membrane protein (UPF0127 family)